MQTTALVQALATCNIKYVSVEIFKQAKYNKAEAVQVWQKWKTYFKKPLIKLLHDLLIMNKHQLWFHASVATWWKEITMQGI